jgi:hypothetical protein
MIHHISHFDPIWHNERNVADALAWHGYHVECYQVDRPNDRPGQNGAPPVVAGDVVFTSVPQSIDIAELKRYKDAGAKLVCWYWDWLWGLGKRDTEYTPALLLMDAVFSTDGFDDAEYVARGITKRFYLPQGAMPEDRILIPRAGTPAHDVVLIGHIGSGYPFRDEMRRRLSAKYDFANYGDYARSNRRVWGRELVGILQNTKIAIGTNYRNDVPGYWSDRIYVTLNAGGFYLGQYVPGIDRFFKDGVHCGFFDGVDDMMIKVEWWLAHDAERDRCRRAGYALARDRDTYIHRVDQLIEAWRRLGIIA